MTYTYGGVNYTGSLGKLLTRSEYAFGSGAVGGLMRKTVFSYWDDANPSYKTKNIVDRVTDGQLQDSAGVVKAETKITYDSTPLTSVTGVASHDDVNYGTSNTIRGNPTVIQRWGSGTTFLSAALSYDTTGQLIQITDPAGNQTSLSYSDNFFNDSAPPQNPPPFYLPPAPTNAYLTQVTVPIIGAASLGYYYGTGKRAFSKDQNGADTYQHFLDNLDRLTHTYAPLTNGNRGWTLTNYTSATVTDTYATLNDAQAATTCTSCRHDQTTVDGLGRVITTVLSSDPDGATSTDTVYDTTGRTQSVSRPYRSTTDPTYGLETSAYDGLDRTVKSTHPDNNSIQTYYGAAVTGGGGAGSQLCSSVTYGLGHPSLVVDDAGKKRRPGLMASEERSRSMSRIQMAI